MSDAIDGWILLDVWCDKYREEASTVHKRVHDNTWARGEIYAAPDGGQVYIHEERARAWLKKRGRLVL